MSGSAITIHLGADAAVSGVLHEPERGRGVALALGHGAGNDMHHPLLVAVAEGLAARGVAVLRFNFLYKELGRRAPDPPAKLEHVFHAAAAALRARAPGRLFIGGKSMGGRIASQLAARGEPCDGLAFLGYPLHAAGKPGKLRDGHLAAITAPMLFIQGTRDPLCDLSLLHPTIARIGARASLHIVEGGDHSFDLLKSAKRTRESVYAEIVEATAAWIDACVGLTAR